MLKLYESTQGSHVLSLRIGRSVARIVMPIINPNNLFIEGWYVEDLKTKENLILLTNDIREIIPQGFVINDYEVLADKKELVRLNKILELNFNLLGLKTVSENGTNYGKVNDFAFDTNSSFIQKLYVSQPIIKSLSNGNLSVDRTQIIEITNKKVTISDPLEKGQIRTPSAGVAA